MLDDLTNYMISISDPESGIAGHVLRHGSMQWTWDTGNVVDPAGHGYSIADVLLMSDAQFDRMAQGIGSGTVPRLVAVPDELTIPHEALVPPGVPSRRAAVDPIQARPDGTVTIVDRRVISTYDLNGVPPGATMAPDGDGDPEVLATIEFDPSRGRRIKCTKSGGFRSVAV
ncbi:MAG: hypothetical protein ACE5GB_03075 [Acidimicrobiales bacterium]